MTKKQQETTKELLQDLAADLMLTLTNEHINDLVTEIATINKQLQIIAKNINTTNVEPLHYPLPIINNTLRSDETITESLELKSVLALAPTTEKNYIVINEVLTHEN